MIPFDEYLSLILIDDIIRQVPVKMALAVTLISFRFFHFRPWQAVLTSFDEYLSKWIYMSPPFKCKVKVRF